MRIEKGKPKNYAISIRGCGAATTETTGTIGSSLITIILIDSWICGSVPLCPVVGDSNSAVSFFPKSGSISVIFVVKIVLKVSGHFIDQSLKSFI